MNVMKSCTGCVRLPLQLLLAEGCSLLFALQSSSCPGYVVDGTPSFLRLLHGLTQGSCVQGLLPVVSFGCCICSLCQAVATQETDPVGISMGGYGVAKLLGCSGAMWTALGSTQNLLWEQVLPWPLCWSLLPSLGWGVLP